MKIEYKNKLLEYVLKGVSLAVAVVIAGSFVLLYGFKEPQMSMRILHGVQIGAFFVLIAIKLLRYFNAYSSAEWLRANWFEVPLLTVLFFVLFGAGVVFRTADPGQAKMFALGIYLLLQVIIKGCQSTIQLAATGRNPTIALISIFVFLILIGSGFLMLPRSYNTPDMSYVDALFTATSATCVTGLIVQDTGTDFSLMGQMVILALIQLGGLGIVIFGAVLALLVGQALSVRESVAMQDLLSSQTLGKIGNIIGFIVVGTFLIEAAGALALYGMWDTPETTAAGRFVDQKWNSIFHSISAFCNAGFSLHATSLMKYAGRWQVYAVIAPLIVLGGLGFGVIYNLVHVWTDRVKHLFKRKLTAPGIFDLHPPTRLGLQTKIVLTTSVILLAAGTGMLWLFEETLSSDPMPNGVQAPADASAYPETPEVLDAFFQSVTARTAGFNTVDIERLSAPSKLTLIVLMSIGGSPGSTAGGFKTVTFAVVLMVVLASLRKRNEVELFKRSIRLVIVGRAITVVVLYILIYIVLALALSITERANPFTMGDVLFETASALGTVGLSTGITPALTPAGKLIIIAAMLIGRLGPLTLLATITFNIKPAGYNYPDEPVVVG